uniref:Sterol 14-demethylase n=1 Tax=Polytomella parva TaxID=51329 RepID=A0A7S0UU60_9CHLO|nr:sterol 14 desaturase (STE14) [Polytomella parva]|mmetsp:Transcript_17998/g.32870  ORF Transcript_17998/g.32870 Transcript_17998/m.32870 type:complete len:491 (+) Transcript_17998:30-1502(+)|eukprot:CAMPEP_0175078700 /NCGR_PEP_ID=MMETSP0052_2-20121109/24309_1 /TAXON_ID=51329 ORGANISM="Polytomella parva, Strain SAG 63-3" /NCGR_SAMPLE_ID=MMETSP0052_2 /ASSEMBLY_ACC=CAM_ASM_000194 /LENGTH=490 /DNA_ID=CAMNT_0016348741 /DNA_START=27 /DNA_END=1499 /DNA_ORIENTATION=+
MGYFDELTLQTAALHAVILLLTACIGRIIYNNLPSKRPPIFEGIPYVGGLIKFASGPWNLVQDGYKNFGEIFTVPVAHKRVTFLIGPDVAPHFFKAAEDEMSQSEVYDFNIPTFGPGVVFDVELKVRVEQFRFFTEALKKDRLKKYVPLFVEEAESYFSKWGDSGVVDFKEEFSRLITLTASRTLLGREVREQMFERVSELLHELDEGMVPLSVFFPYLPIPPHQKRDRARKELSSVFSKIIRARRASGAREEDVLQQFIDARYQNVYNGRALTEEEITGLLIAVLFAGQHTSSITTSWTGIFMNAYKKNGWDPAVTEQKAILAKHGNELSFDILQDMEVLQRCIMEALRMHPPLLLLMRYARAPFNVTTSSGKDYVVPKGDVVVVSPNFSHMLPHLFERPESYEPDRFTAPRDEDKKKTFTYIGFGGGRHACIGANFAYLQIKTIWSVLMRNFEFELLDPVPEADYDSMVIGPKPCRIKYTRRKTPLTA